MALLQFNVSVGENTRPTRIQESAGVDELFRKVSADCANGVNPDDILLVFGGVHLEYDKNKSFKDYNLVHMSTLTLLVGLHGGGNSKSTQMEPTSSSTLAQGIQAINTKRLKTISKFAEVYYNDNIEALMKYLQSKDTVASSSEEETSDSENNTESLDESIQLEERERKGLRPLPGFIELTTEPDMISDDDDPTTKRAKMPCGHVMGPESMTDYFRDIVNNGRFKFICPTLNCNCEWEYFIVRHVACLTDEEMQEFEKKLENNFLEKEKGKQTCPGCKTWCMRDPGTGNRVRCQLCTLNNGKKFDFCWVCLKEWKRFLSSGPCGNRGCDGKDKRIYTLTKCPTKRIHLCLECPCIRGCPKCGLLIEHQDRCGHVSCRSCHCKFCFICLKVFEAGENQCNSLGTCKLAPRQVPKPGN